MKKIKKCKFCGSINNLHISKVGNIMPICEEHYIENKENIQKKKKITLLDKYGVEHFFQSNLFKEKSKETNLERYGVSNPNKRKEIREKIIETNLKKYGTLAPAQNVNVKEKIRKSNEEKYNVSWAFQDESIKDKIKQTNLKKYNVDNPSKVPFIIKEQQKTRKNNYWDTFINKLFEKKIIPIFNKEYYIQNNSNFTYKCIRCGRSFVSNIINAQDLHCGCLKSRSSYEDEIIDWLLSLNISNIEKNKKFIENKKYGYEIDIYLPDYKVGIDYHGLYFHTDKFCENKYHQKKYEYFSKLGIIYLQIFENEWANNKDIIKSLIKINLKFINNSNYKKFLIKEISYKDARIFIKNNSLYKIKHGKYVGAFYKNELINIICFRLIKNNIWKVENICEKINFHSEKSIKDIINYFNNLYKPNKLIYFSDLRFHNNIFLKKIKFYEKKLLRPKYFSISKGKKTYTIYDAGYLRMERSCL